MKFTWLIAAIAIALALLAGGTALLLEDSSSANGGKGEDLESAGQEMPVSESASKPDNPDEKPISTRDFGVAPEPEPPPPPKAGPVDFRELLRRGKPKTGNITMRLIGRDGLPLANAPGAFHVWVITERDTKYIDGAGNLVRWRNRREPIRVRTDGEGKIRFSVPSGLPGVCYLFPERPWRSWLHAPPHSKPHPPFLAKESYASLTPEEERDLGDVQLVDGPILVSGRVVDAFGITRGGVMVHVYAMPVKPWEPGRRARRGLRRRSGRRTSSLDELRVEHFGEDGTRLMSLPTDHEGQFEIQDKAASAVRYAITAGYKSRGQMAYPRTFNAGQVDMTMDLQESGSLRGSVKMQFMDTATRPQVSWRFSAPLERLRLWQKFKAKAEGTFQTPNLAPGLYDLRVSMFGRKERLFLGLLVRSGEASTPPRLQELQLAEGLEVADVQVVNLRGQGLAGIEVTLISSRRSKRGSTSSLQTSGVTGALGNVRFLIERDTSYHLETDQAGYERFQRTANFPMQVTLRGSMHFDVTFNPPLPTPTDGGKWNVILVPADVESLKGARNLRLRNPESASARHLEPGPYRLHARFQRKPPAKTMPYVLLGAINIPHSKSPFTTILKPPDAALRTHLAGEQN